MATGKALGPTLRHADGLTSADFSPDGRRLLTCGIDRTARVWEIASGPGAASSLEHEGRVRFAAFSPDGSRIVTRQPCRPGHGRVHVPPLGRDDGPSPSRALPGRSSGVQSRWSIPRHRRRRTRAALSCPHGRARQSATGPGDYSPRAGRSTRAASARTAGGWSPRQRGRRPPGTDLGHADGQAGSSPARPQRV